MIKAITTENWKLRLLKHPSEESYSFHPDTGAFSVADGVTRDPMEFFQDGFLGKLKFTFNYPRPSPAKIAANIFCQTFPVVIRDFRTIDEKTVRQAFQESNTRIRDWNNENIPYIDYVTNDYAGCVASAAVQKSGVLTWGFITDCGVAVFDNNGELRFRTPSEDPHRLDSYVWQDPYLKEKSWNHPEARARIRSNYRNNPSEPHSFGVLTGQEEAMSYVRTGTQETNPGDYLLVYSDGLEPVIFSGEFSDKLRQGDTEGLEKLCRKKVRTEGTLVLKRI
jgi:hypothetical protein